MVRRVENSCVYSRTQYFSRATVRLFRFLRILIICSGLILLVLGIVTIFVSTRHGTFPVSLLISSFLGGAICLWAYDFGQGRVVVTPEGIKTRNLARKTVRKVNIESLDIVHSPLGKDETTIPTLHLKDGKVIVLLPLEWSEKVGSEQPNWTYYKQQEIVHEIRKVLGVQGLD